MPTNPLDVMKQYAAREAEQFALLEKQPLQELVGVLTPRGIGGVQTSGRPWMLVVFVSAWRLDDGPVHERELRLLGPMAERTINKLQDATKGFEIVRMRVRMLPPDRPTPEKGDPSPPDGLIVEWQGVVTDEALAPVATRLAKPVVVVDPVLGTLTLDRGLGRFDGKVKWGASEARLSIDGVGKKPAAKGLAAARDVVARGAHWEKLARDGAVKDLFETW
ncbi:MAG TPA: DUF2262 domain-containing protein, partial [Phycisphaerales bacterium]|nr:DUF2262 domain-containing protein [Phycisphaerales bacterium]